jgi:hypothetical protein
MNYQRIYDNIINKGKTRVLTEYTESHHILPKCKGGTDDPYNLVNLTPEEHYTCHQLLVKIYPDDPSILKAAMFMTANGMGRRSNKVYGWLKRKYSEYMKGPNNPAKLNGVWNKGVTGYKNKVNFSEKSLKQFSERMKNKNPCAGVKPWNHPRATEYTKSVWVNANKIRAIWEKNNKPSYCKLYSLVNGKAAGKNWEAIGPYMNIIKYFKSGWIPEEDIDWKIIRANYDRS